MIKQKIKKDLEKTIEKTLKIKVDDVYLEQPENPEYGDYASNFAMAKLEEIRSTKSAGREADSPQESIRNPMDLAQRIVKNFPKTKYLEKIEVIKPGFINFYLKNKVFQDNLTQILKQNQI